MELCSIASGSNGNCIYTGDDNTHLLIDAGISGKRIEAGLNNIELKASDISGILVTHEHSDHIGGLGVMARRHGIPIYATVGTIDAIKHCSGVGKIDPSLFHEVKEDEEFTVGTLNVRPIRVSHDAAQPVAYRVGDGEKNVAVMTDLGYFDDYIVDNISGLDILLLESNHDIRMLETGRYPYHLKQRILGKRGHLSNETAGRLLCRVLHDDIKHVFLGHLSGENNYDKLAFETVRMEIDMGDNPYSCADFDLRIASRYESSEKVSV